MENFLTENLTYSQANIITEAAVDDKGHKNWYMEGIFVQGDVRNLNNRIYPISEIRKAVDDVNARAQDFTVWGELDHPESMSINLDRVSHFIEKMWMDGKNGMGRLKIVDTLMGQTVTAMLSGGGRLGVSSRGTGELNYDGIVTDYAIQTVDIVATPSAKDARPVAIFETFNGRGGSKREDLIKAVQHDPKAQKYLQKELLNWLDNLK